MRHADLAGEQDVLARLRHRAVDGRDDEDRAVHLRGARDHVLHVVGVAWAVDVSIVTVRRRVLDVRGGDRQNLRRVAATLGLGRLGDFVVRRSTSRSNRGQPKPSSTPRSTSSCRGRRVQSCRRCSAACSAQILPWPSLALLSLPYSPLAPRQGSHSSFLPGRQLIGRQPSAFLKRTSP